MILLLGFYIAYKNQERQNAEKMVKQEDVYHEGKNIDDVDREVTGNSEDKGDYELFGLGLGIGRTGKKVDECQEKKLR